MESQKLEQCLYLDNFKDIASLDMKIVKLISNSIGDKILYEQFKKSKIIKREFSNSGYFCTLLCGYDTKSIQNGFVGNLNLILQGQNVGGAMLFLENGILKMIECYFWEECDFIEGLLK